MFPCIDSHADSRSLRRSYCPFAAKFNRCVNSRDTTKTHASTTGIDKARKALLSDFRDQYVVEAWVASMVISFGQGLTMESSPNRRM